MSDTKLIFFDLDGTLVPIGGKTPQSTLTALKKAQTNGHKIFINTGRSKSQIYDYLLDFGFDGIVSGTGCYIEVAGKTIFFDPFSEEAYQQTTKVLNSYDIPRLVQSQDTLLSQPEYLKALVYGFGHMPKEEVTQEIAIDFMKTFGEITIGGFETFTQNFGPVENICFADAPITYKELEKLLPTELRIVASSIDGSIQNAGEIVKRNCTKGSAVKMLADYYGTDMSNTVAFGDGDNDVDMIKTAGVGIAMGNADDKLINNVDMITGSCDKSGIYDALTKLNII